MAKSRAAPLWFLLLCFTLFCGHVAAVSAVLGVDLGTEYIKAALVKPGIPLEIVLTKDSRRKEISAIAFKPPPGGAKPDHYPERAYGSDAMSLTARFPGDVYPNLKTLLGVPVDGNTVVEEYKARHPALKIEEHSVLKTVAFKSAGAFPADEEAWLVEELLAMELQSIRRNAEALAGHGTSVSSAVITVPPFYTIQEKRAVEFAADLAGLRVLSLISDGMAVGLNYATTRQFPNVNKGEKPELHMVFDMGAGSTKATLLKFQSRSVKDVGKYNKTIQEVEELASGWDKTLGGDALNALIIDDMVARFVATSGAKSVSATVDQVKSHGRAIAKLSKEAERMRHVLSANTETSASFESLFEDVDFRYKISRTEFEAMAEAHASRVTAVVKQVLAAANLDTHDLGSLILHGGATRTPFVQKQLEKIFGDTKKLRNNVNSDEAAVFGAAFRGAEMSPSFRVKEIRVSEGAAFGVAAKWPNAKSQKVQTQQLWTSTSHLGAAPKELTFRNTEDFEITFYQLAPSTDGQTERPTKILTTQNLTATVASLGEKHSCDPSTVLFKLGLRLSSNNGEVEVTKAVAECETEEPEKESIMDGVKNLFGFGKKEQQPLEGDAEASQSADASAKTSESAGAGGSTSTKPSTSSSTPLSSSAAAAATPDNQPKKKVTVTVPVKFELVKMGTPQLSKADAQKLKDRFKAFEASDRARFQREETLNQLEAFTYKVRDLLDNEDFITASTEDERTTLEKLSQETGDWLYDEGADAPREELLKKFRELKDIVDPIETRRTEAQERPKLITALKESLKQADDFTKSIRERIADYESFHASKSASASSTESTASTETTVAPSSVGDFDGLEDSEPAATASVEFGDESPQEDAGPVPPIYSIEDLTAPEELYTSVSAWLSEKEVAQRKLGPNEDPVLSIKDLKAKKIEVDKVNMDLAMKAVRNFENSQKKTKSNKAKSNKAKSNKAKSKKAAKTTTASTQSASSETPSPSSSTKESKDKTVKHEEL